MSGNIEGFGNTKFMWFLIKYKQLLKNYNEMQHKVSRIIHKKVDNEPVYNYKYLKASARNFRRLK